MAFGGLMLSPVLTVYVGRAAGFEPELVKLATLPRFQLAIPTLDHDTTQYKNYN
jgi:hypothetical protein